MKKRILCFVLITSFLCSACAISAVADDPTERWRTIDSEPSVYEEVKALSSYESTGSISDDGQETLALDMTLANLMYVLWWASDCPEPTWTNNYSDVSSEDPFCKAIVWAEEAGIWRSGGMTYGPHRSVSRSTLIGLLYRWAGSPSVDGLNNPYLDVANTDWFYSSVVWSANDPRVDVDPILKMRFRPEEEAEELIAVKTNEGVSFTLTIHEWETVYDNPPDCTNFGTERSRCSSCGLIIDSIRRKTHDLVLHLEKAPSCTEPGWYPYYTCSKCDYSTYEEIPPLGHDLVHVEAQSPTCYAVGWNAYDVCGRCGYSTYEEIPALGHDFIRREAKEPTCTGAGWDEYEVCTRCGWLTRKIISPLGHYFGSDRSENACLRCGAKKPGNFSDVPAGEYYANAVTWAIDREITSGTGAGKFSPNDDCTRCQVVTFLWRAAGSPEPEKKDNPFVDVKLTDYFYKAVLWAVESGITLGTSKTEFSPNESCTRGQIVTFIYRSKGQPDPVGNALIPFVDIEVFDYFYFATIWATLNGVTKGTDASHFSPNDTCTRAQIVTFLYRSAGK